MHRVPRHAVLLTLLLSALLLRGVLPAGYMLGGVPGEGGLRVVLCTAQGPVVQADALPDHAGQDGLHCPFALALGMGALPVLPFDTLAVQLAAVVLPTALARAQGHSPRASLAARGPPSRI